MGEQLTQRRLAAILAADIAGYSRLMNEDEDATVDAWQAARTGVIKPSIAEYSGRIVKHTGDGFLAEFPTVSEAVPCAVTMQRQFAMQNADIPDPRRMKFRMGINLGEITVDEDDIHGDGVNIAARLEGLAEAPGICVTASVYDQVRKKVDCAFEDMGEHQVKNIAESIHVYKILCGVPAEHEDDEAAAPEPAGADGAKARADKPSIAVLPFVNMSADPEQEYFADGLTEDILTQLPRFKELFVISRNSTFTYKDKAVKVQEVARDLGVGYVVEGSIRKAGERVRVTVQLIEGAEDRHVWAERYDRNLEDIFAIQDEITAAIVATLPGRVEADSHDRARHTPADNMAAYECVLAGKVLHHNSSRDDNAAALELLDRAIELDPGYAHARAWRACVLGQSSVHGWDEDPEATLQEAAHEVERARALDENDADVNRILAALHIRQDNHDQAMLHQKKALNLNPNYDLVVVQHGELMTWLGRPDEGVEWIKKAMQLNPFHPPRFWSHLSRAYFVGRRYPDAIEAIKQISAPDQMHHSYLAACYAYLDDEAQAAAHRQEVLDQDPDFSVGAHMATQHYLKDADHAHHRDGLLKAGLRE
ncbi:MAG: adenylate/guanylate cyclase domain-containing protein [Rhodospirillales bacterium]|nr:adenylate/guanylate cyclase domain-containing protein [Rhodospirillales bacterium]